MVCNMCIDKGTIPQGISPEDKRRREQIIIDFYRKWADENPTRKVYNLNLRDYINVRFISVDETAHHASKTYLSTLAVLQLSAILTCAKKVRVGKPRSRTNQQQFQAMIEMVHECPGVGLVRLMVGVRRKSLLKIQYCITAVTVDE